MTKTSSEERFAFGQNWARFLEHLNEDRIVEAEKSLKEKLDVQELKGKVFLDVGSGSGLFSLAAYRLGAHVYSFDFDADSVQCTQYLKNHYTLGDGSWSIEQGSILDSGFLEKFEPADIVYSWGVLHHTGNMRQAFENVAPLVKEGGQLFISIYNDQGGSSILWKKIKKTYNGSGFLIKMALIICAFTRLWMITFIKDLFKSGNPFRTWIAYGANNRGMSAWYDILDWVGGYPFEVAKPEEFFEFFKKKGFYLEKMKTCRGGLGCNEFVFTKGPCLSS